MNRTRASAFGQVPDLDISGFAPKPQPDAMAPAPEKVREISEAARFPSRESPPPKAGKPKRARRQYRTGRNVQLNVKAAQSTIDALYAISDQQGWVLGETLDRALAALRHELAAGK